MKAKFLILPLAAVFMFSSCETEDDGVQPMNPIIQDTISTPDPAPTISFGDMSASLIAVQTTTNTGPLPVTINTLSLIHI